MGVGVCVGGWDAGLAVLGCKADFGFQGNQKI